MELEIKRFNNFAKKEQGRKDYQQVKDFAVNDFFTRQTQTDQEIIASAYARIERGTAGRYDLRIIMDYWNACRREYGIKAKAEGRER
jgi:hypothetical protein